MSCPLLFALSHRRARCHRQPTAEAVYEHWLPRLVGVERSVELIIGEGADADVIRSVVEEDHAAQLTREEATASVHYVRFELTAEQVPRFGVEPVAVAIDHPDYHEQTRLGPDSVASLLDDLR